MKQGVHNRQFALAGVLLAAIGLASAFLAREVSRRLIESPPSPVHTAAVPRPAPTPKPALPSEPITAVSPDQAPRQEPVTEAAPEMTIQVKGDANTITLDPSGFISKKPDYQLNGDGGRSVFLVGPQQTARIELLGDGNTVLVAAKLKDRVTIVNNGDGNNVAD